MATASNSFSGEVDHGAVRSVTVTTNVVFYCAGHFGGYDGAKSGRAVDNVLKNSLFQRGNRFNGLKLGWVGAIVYVFCRHLLPLTTPIAV